MSIFDKRHPNNNPNHILSGCNMENHMKWYEENRERLLKEDEEKFAIWRKEEEIRLSKMTPEEIEEERRILASLGVG